MRRQPLERRRSRDPPCARDCARIWRTASGMQRGAADPAARADAAEQRPGLALRDRLPGQERLHRTGLGMLAARQTDLGPLALPGRSCSRAMRSLSPLAAMATSSTCSATSSDRRSAPAKPNSSSARSRRPRALGSQVASSRRSMASVSAAAFARAARAGAAGPAAAPGCRGAPGSTADR